MCDVLDRAEARGIEQGKMMLLLKMAADGTITVQQAAREAGMDVEVFEKKMKKD